MRKTLYTCGIIALLSIAIPTLAACTDISADLGSKSTDSNSKGAVTKLQNFLKDTGYLTTLPNGVYGPATLTAVKKFQTAEGVNSTGFIGPLSRATIRTKSCSVSVPPRTTLEKATLITSPREGTSLVMGKTQTIHWKNEIKSNYSIILENEEGVSQGYIAATRLGGTSFEWRVGDVFNTESQRNIVVAPGKYKIRIRNTYSGTSLDDPQSGVFTLTAEPLSAHTVFPLTIPVGQESTVVIYGAGFNDQTSVYLDGPFNIRTNRMYTSPDRKVFVFSIPGTLLAGRHSVWTYNGYENSDTGISITVE